MNELLDNPQNVLLYCTSQGTSIQVSDSQAQNIYLHNAHPDGTVSCDWLKAVASEFAVGAVQMETETSVQEASAAGHAIAQHIGPIAMGKRCNVVMLLQLPVWICWTKHWICFWFRAICELAWFRNINGCACVSWGDRDCRLEGLGI